MQAQDALNEEPLDGQAAEVLVDLDAHVVFNRAAINHIDSFTKDDFLDKKNHSMMNFWTELSPIGRRHSPRFRTKVLRNIRRMFSVNFAQDEICFRLTLFVWLTRMLHPFKHASAHIWRWSRGVATRVRRPRVGTFNQSLQCRFAPYSGSQTRSPPKQNFENFLSVGKEATPSLKFLSLNSYEKIIEKTFLNVGGGEI